MARGQSRASSEASPSASQAQAFDRIPKGIELPFGTIGEDIKNESNLYDSISNYLNDYGVDGITKEMEAASLGFEKEAQALREGAQDAANDVESAKEYAGAGESSDETRVFRFENSPPIQVKYSVEMDTKYTYDRDGEESSSVRYRFRVKDVKIL